MASGNYIVRDIVQYIHDENDYGTQRSVLNVCARLISILCRRLRNTDEMLNEGVIWGFKMES